MSSKHGAILLQFCLLLRTTWVNTQARHMTAATNRGRRLLFRLFTMVLLLESCLPLGLRGAQLNNWHWRNPSPFANTMRSLTFGNGRFVAVGDGGVIHTSLDGYIWDDGRRPVTTSLHKVAFLNGEFTAVGAGGTWLTSSNGLDWVAYSTGASDALFAVAYQNGFYVACGLG